MPKTFTCHKLRCSGVTPTLCIARQHKRRTAGGQTGDLYPMCASAAEVCPQGVKVALAHPDLVPEKRQKAETKPPKPLDFGKGTCQQCGNTFKRNNKVHRFCSYACSNRAKVLKRVKLMCLWCGDPFEAVPSHRRKYCSMDCSIKGRTTYAKEGA